MKNKQAQELLDKAIKLTYKDTIPLFRGIYIIQQRKLHDSGYRMMYIIGYTNYDKKIDDFKYYLISSCSDVVDFEPIFENLLARNYDMCDLHLDIDRNGLIHIWTRSDKKLSIRHGVGLSSCSFEIVN